MDLIDPQYTRVTEILSIFQNYAHVDKAKLKKAQDIGTEVHAGIKDYFTWQFAPMSMRNEPYFESFRLWAETKRVKEHEIMFLEERLYDPSLMITGQVDLVAELDGIPTLIDFKTGSWAHLEIWKLQLTFYRYLIAKKATGEMEHLRRMIPDKFLIVQLDKNGGPASVFPMEYDPRDLEVCFSAYKCYKYFKGWGGIWGPNVLT